MTTAALTRHGWRVTAIAIGWLAILVAFGLSFLFVPGFLTPGSLGAAVLFLAFGVWMGDRLLAIGALSRQPHTAIFDARGISGGIIPAPLARKRGGFVTYRSPILRLAVARMPETGVPWRSLSVRIWPTAGRGRNADLLVNPRAGNLLAYGSLLFDGWQHVYPIPAQRFLELAPYIVREGGRIDLPRGAVNDDLRPEFDREVFGMGGVGFFHRGMSVADVAHLIEVVYGPSELPQPSTWSG